MRDDPDCCTARPVRAGSRRRWRSGRLRSARREGTGPVGGADHIRAAVMSKPAWWPAPVELRSTVAVFGGCRRLRRAAAVPVRGRGRCGPAALRRGGVRGRDSPVRPKRIAGAGHHPAVGRGRRRAGSGCTRCPARSEGGTGAAVVRSVVAPRFPSAARRRVRIELQELRRRPASSSEAGRRRGSMRNAAGIHRDSLTGVPGNREDRPAVAGRSLLLLPVELLQDQTSVRTLVTLGSTEMPGPKVVATVAFWM